MEKGKKVKFILQAIAGILGFIGLIYVFLAFDFIIRGIQEPDNFQLLLGILFLFFGAIPIIIACQAIWFFGAQAIRNITGFVTIVIYIVANASISKYPTENPFWYLCIFIGLIAVLLGIYKFLSKKLIAVAMKDHARELSIRSSFDET
jgi:hypothetical protein